MCKKIFLVSLWLLVVSFVLFADDMEAKDRNVLKYGTDAEITDLVGRLKANNETYLDDDLVKFVAGANDPALKAAVFDLLSDHEKGGAEKAALALIENRAEMSNGVESAHVISAINYLGKVKYAKALEKMRELLEVNDPLYNNAVIKAIARVSPRSELNNTTGYLIDYYNNKISTDDTKRSVIDALGELKNPKTVPFLIGIIKQNTSVPLTMAALNSLSLIEGASGEAPKTASGGEVAKAAIAGSGTEGTNVSEAPNAANVSNGANAANGGSEANSASEEAKGESAGEVTKSESGGNETEGANVSEVPKAASGGEAPKSESGGNKTEGANVSEAANAESVGETPKSESVGEAPQTTSGESPNAASVSAKADGASGGNDMRKESLDAIKGCLDSKDPNIRAAAVAALGSFQGSDVDEAIISGFRDSHYKTRIAAMQSAGARKIAAAVPALKYRAENDKEQVVKNAAVRALGAIGGSDAEAALEGLLNEKKTSDAARLIAATELIKLNPDKYAVPIAAKYEEAKKAKQKTLISGYITALSKAKTANIRDFTARLFGSRDPLELVLAIELCSINHFSGFKEQLEKLAQGDNSIARRAQKLLEE